MPVAVTQSQLTLTSAQERGSYSNADGNLQFNPSCMPAKENGRDGTDSLPKKPEVVEANGIPLDTTKLRNPPWWNRRSRLERILCAVSAISMVMCTAMAVALAVIGYHYQSRFGLSKVTYSGSADKLTEDEDIPNLLSKQKGPDICLTPSCVTAAATIIENMDEKVDPCENFYKFACGGWIQKQTIPDDKTVVSVFSLLQEELDNKLRSLVEHRINDSDPAHILNLKYMYDSCMNITNIEKDGDGPLSAVLKELGSWPVVLGNKWNESQFDWMQFLFTLRRIGFSHNIFLSLSIGPDVRNNSRHIIDLDEATLGMPDRNYLLKGPDDPVVNAYYRLMVDSAKLLGANETQAQKEMKEILEFEIILANYSVPREERRNISRLYNKLTVDDLYKLAPKIDWDRYFNNLLMNQIPRTEEVIVIVPDFVQKWEKLMMSTSKRVIANYMFWRVIGQAFPLLHRTWAEISQEYSAILTGKTRQESRWEYCLGSLTGSLGTALASLYVQNHFKQESKGLALDMVEYIHKEFLKILQEVDWMDEKTKNLAKDKAAAMHTYIGYPNELLNETKVKEIYENLTLSPNSYFKNFQSLRKWATDYIFSKLRQPNIKGDWKKRSNTAVVNAYYNAIENSIEFPAGILQGIFFDKDRLKCLNYGAIGFVIGHEITHGFDDRGRQFDKDGNNVNWWELETDRKFRERATCIINQYGNYTVPEIGLKVNGINTQGENIADNGGLKEAFRAYEQWVINNGPEPLLPGLKYTPNQLFWISAANVWCGKYRPEVLKLRILTGSHSPAEFRIIGPLSNSPEFAKEFKCPLGSDMNPVNKCSVW